jgi:hypothetical protein
MRCSWPSIDPGDGLYRTVCLPSHHRDEVEYTLYVVAAKSISVFVCLPVGTKQYQGGVAGLDRSVVVREIFSCELANRLVFLASNA